MLRRQQQYTHDEQPTDVLTMSSMASGRSKRTIADLTASDVDPVMHALLPFVAGLDRDDDRTAGVVDAVEHLFLKLKQTSVSVIYEYELVSDPKPRGSGSSSLFACPLTLLTR